MTTIRTIITQALRSIASISQNASPTDEDISICLAAFNTMIDSLSTRILNIHTIRPSRYLIEAGKSEYRLGPEFDSQGQPTGADWITPRPMRVENAVLMVYATVSGTPPQQTIGETSSTLFYNLELINFQQYADITVRRLQTTWPTSVYDDRGYPVRTLTLWPVPQQDLAIELWLWEPLATYDSLDDPLNLPPGYARYFTLMLAREVCPDFQAVWTPTLQARLEEAEAAVKSLNQQTTFSQQTSLGRAVVTPNAPYVTSNGKYNRVPRTW